MVLGWVAHELTELSEEERNIRSCEDHRLHKASNCLLVLGDIDPFVVVIGGAEVLVAGCRDSLRLEGLLCDSKLVKDALELLLLVNL